MNRCLERGQLCPREPDNWDSRTWLSALLSIAGSWTVSRSKRNKELSMNRSAGHRPGSFQKLEHQLAGAVPGAPAAFNAPPKMGTILPSRFRSTIYKMTL